MRAIISGDPGVVVDGEGLRQRLNRPFPPGLALEGDAGAGETNLKPASVLVPIVAHSREFTVIFTRRNAQLRSHSGQISFPGGRAETADATAEATALRETEEETGLAGTAVEVLGRLPEYHTRTGYRVVPVVGMVRPPLQLEPEPTEVDEVFEVPLSFLLDPRNHRLQSRVFEGEVRSFFAIRYQERYIWGVTAGIVVNLYRRLAA